MGRKNRKSSNVEVGLPRNVRRETLEIVSILLDRCSSPFGSHGQSEWTEFLEVYNLVEKLRKKQQNYVIAKSGREKNFDGFMGWLKSNSVDAEAVEIQHFDVGGYGIKATRDFKEGELFLAIPRSVMMTTDTAKNSALGALIADNRILQTMPNILLALHVLCELCSPASFWLPYLKILPHSYSSPLYFNPEDLQLLKASPTLSEMINQFRNITRQYAYFFNLFQGHELASKLPIQVKNICYDDYRWAVSSVMTRQNQIPTLDGQRMISALIPLWDMCNHTNGQITTDFSLKNDRSECFSLEGTVAGAQVFIFYGSRSNAELLIHNGFVYPQNHSDRLTIRLGISKNDPLFSMKSEVLSRLSMQASRLFSLHCGVNPVDSDTLAFLRVVVMTEDDLRTALACRQQISKLRDFDDFVSEDNERKAWAFLATRVLLLLKAYPTSAQEDATLLQGNDLSTHARLAVQLRHCEKNILMSTHEYANRMMDSAEERVKAQPATIEDDLDHLESQLNEETPALPTTTTEGKAMISDDLEAEMRDIKLAEL
ncbi:hypothetical protein CAPTEDRAFT_181634 [Capitella teleta]|uniref:protein-histidine N-methyltransferase n=1 Tax=Capitella teleta TaxID=283909 RepID=R7UY49_CAPTE|nr:hypothetical protein CAPTEDRAFT_181634 [Capitella teleta]|eukprot:ELU11224.1 hypothetical protein CAPTEDRAFT_181634 [Capitella teleta]